MCDHLLRNHRFGIATALVAALMGVSGCTSEGVIGTVSTRGGQAGTGGSGSTGGGAGSNTEGGADGSSDVAVGNSEAGADSGGIAVDGSTGTVNEVILRYDFEEGGGTTATDVSGNHNDGLLNDCSWTAQGRNGGALGFAAADTSVSMPHAALANAHQLTVATWVNLTANAAESRLFYFGAGTDAYLSFALNDSNAGMSLRFKTPGGTEQVVTTPTQLPLNVWKHVAVTFSGDGTAIYVDGKIVMQSASTLDPAALGSITEAFVGNGPGGAQPLSGTLDEIVVLNRAATAAEIATMAWPKNDYSMFHFDEGSGTVAADSSDRAKHGTLVNNAGWVPGVFGSAVRLDNPTTPPAAQYVDLADGIIADCDANLTVAGWLNLESLNDNARYLDFGNDVDHYVYVVPRYNGSNVLRFSLKNLNANNRASGTAFTWNTSQWYHVAIVRQATAVSLYVDGVLLTGNPSLSTGFAVNAFGSTVSNYFGKSQDDTMAGLDASIDEILVSCRAYTGDEIKQLAYRP